MPTVYPREIAPPRYYRKAQKALRRAQRAVARKQKGSNCRKKAAQRLGDRVHHCPSCGYVTDRDLNAAQNILRLGRSLQASTFPVGGVA